MLRVWLVRHGESESNAGAPSTDPGASPLTARGREQAERVAARLPEAPGLIVTSPFRRAAQTAEPTIERYPDTSVEEWPVQEFTYLGGFHDRVSTSEERRPYVEEYWRRADPDLSVDGAESFTDLLKRVRDCLDRLTVQSTGTVAVFTHGFFIRALMWVVLSDGAADHDGMRAFHRFSEGVVVPNGAIVGLFAPPGSTPRLVAGTAW
ncbi:histidine phosphatase family protein [Actinophytocola oryzae]|uniref:Broad specificity phosphatase PhoE n=1 Tax=Actinophytocola oryzae TaxID=502181 RepID=A0A4V3FRT7_9PSEU|nr:histidine phosphatase family protein [Actinophytocola oryzae]TDV44811.1 broad specificity phosphatase PhoE [Actinophytocola oryzae]